jgi:hypothetical protein
MPKQIEMSSFSPAGRRSESNERVEQKKNCAVEELYSDEPSRIFKWIIAIPQSELTIRIESLEAHFRSR